MSFLDDAKKKLSAAYGKHGAKIDEGLDKATRAASDYDRKKTGGKHSDKIAKGAAKAREGLGKLDDRGNPGTGPTGDPRGPRP